MRKPTFIHRISGRTDGEGGKPPFCAGQWRSSFKSLGRSSKCLRGYFSASDRLVSTSGRRLREVLGIQRCQRSPKKNKRKKREKKKQHRITESADQLSSYLQLLTRRLRLPAFDSSEELKMDLVTVVCRQVSLCNRVCPNGCGVVAARRLHSRSLNTRVKLTIQRCCHFEV